MREEGTGDEMGMTEDEARATQQAAAEAGYPTAEVFAYTGEPGSYGVALWLEPHIGGLTTLEPYDAEEWRQRIAQYWLDAAVLKRKDQERAAQSGERIWYE